MSQKEFAIPLAYFITFSCYGTWLHGGKDASVDREHNIPETDFLSSDPTRYARARQRMKEEPYFLEGTQRHIVLNSISEVCRHRKWDLLAAHVRTNHIHLVVHALSEPEFIMNTIKSYASRHLNQSEIDQKRAYRWTRHGSTKYLWREEEVESAIQYVVYEQGAPMAVYENKNRLVENHF